MSGQGEAQAKRPAGGFDDSAARAQLAAGTGPFDHVQTGTVLDAAGVEALQLRPEAASAGGGKGLGHPQHRGVAHEPAQGRARRSDGSVGQ